MRGVLVYGKYLKKDNRKVLLVPIFIIMAAVIAAVFMVYIGLILLGIYYKVKERLSGH